MRKPAKAKKTKRTTKRVKVTAKPVEKTKAATKFTPAAAPTVTRSKAARANISEGNALVRPGKTPDQSSVCEGVRPEGAGDDLGTTRRSGS
jgi:hypothetical protein